MEKNTLKGITYSGISTRGTIQVLSNTIDCGGKAKQGIYYNFSEPGARIAGNTILNPGKYGIITYNGKGLKIEDNKITGSSGHGIRVNTPDTVISGNCSSDASGVLNYSIRASDPECTLSAAREFARRNGQLENLEEKLKYLGSYSDKRTLCFLSPDGAPYSFNVVMFVWDEDTDDWKNWFQGGLIYHGTHDNGGDGSAPTFSVNLNPVNGWAFHT